MTKCILRIRDQVNVKAEGLDPQTRKELVKRLSFMNPKARHTPAFKLGRWDGKVPFATIGGGTYFNLLEQALPVILDAGYEIDIVDERPPNTITLEPITDQYFADIQWPAGHQLAGQPIILNDHQVRAANDYLTPNQYGNHHLIQSIATGAGKTMITATLSKQAQPYGRTLVIVPSKDLVTQTADDYRNVGLDTGIYYSDMKETDNQHIISTWQSMTRMHKEENENFNKIVNGVVAIIIDEAHILLGKSLKELMCDPLAHIPLRWGMTGTIPKEPHEYNALICSVGPKGGEIRADELQEKGILSNCTIDIMQLVDDVSFKAWDQEINYLTSDPVRISFIAQEIKRIAETGNTLVLVSRTVFGKALSDILEVSYLYGDITSKKRKEQYKAVNIEDNKIIVASYGIAAVGINLPRIFNLVLIESGRSYRNTIQSVGRGLRIAHDKDHVNIVDICSTAKFSKRHLTDRKSYYSEAGYPHKVRKITYR